MSENEALHPISPYIAVAAAADAIAWYADAFGAIETMRYEGDDGRVGHAELTIGATTLMLADEYPEMGVHGPVHYGGTPVMLYLPVDNVDYIFDRAVELGAVAAQPPEDRAGGRRATIVDPFGHRWMLSGPAPDTEHPGRVEDDDFGGFTVTGRAPVELGYLVMTGPDRDKTAAFYTELFGWQIGGGSEGGHVNNTKFPLGVGPGSGEAQAMPMFRVDDLNAYADRVRELGGKVLGDEITHRAGSHLPCEDDQGLFFALWKPASGF